MILAKLPSDGAGRTLQMPAIGAGASEMDVHVDWVRRVQQEQGLTVLLISHDLSVVFRYATNVLCLSRERAWFGPPRTILTPELLHELHGTPVEFHVHGP